jgi:hypothetical protein
MTKKYILSYFSMVAVLCATDMGGTVGVAPVAGDVGGAVAAAKKDVKAALRSSVSSFESSLGSASEESALVQSLTQQIDVLTVEKARAERGLVRKPGDAVFTDRIAKLSSQISALTAQHDAAIQADADQKRISETVKAQLAEMDARAKAAKDAGIQARGAEEKVAAQQAEIEALTTANALLNEEAAQNAAALTKLYNQVVVLKAQQANEERASAVLRLLKSDVASKVSSLSANVSK